MYSLYKVMKQGLFAFTLCLFMSFMVSIPKVFAFDKNLVLQNKDVAFLPIRFSSPKKIQDFLEFHQSVLANYMVEISFEPSDDYIQPSWTQGQPNRLIPYYVLQSKYATKMKVSDFIWEMSQGDMNNVCSPSLSICLDNKIEKLNPAFILAVIQKESGLVYGACAKSDADTNPACGYSKVGDIRKLQHRLERATGYYCFENSDKSKGCWDENPDWKYYKGLFRQVYYSMTMLRMNVKKCDLGYGIKLAQPFYTGNTVWIDGQTVFLGNGITCAMYIYTPHISSTTADVLDYMQGNVDFIEESLGNVTKPAHKVKLF